VEWLHSRFGERSCTVICLVSSMKSLHFCLVGSTLEQSRFRFLFGSGVHRSSNNNNITPVPAGLSTEWSYSC
jgi:hypothetical protein